MEHLKVINAYKSLVTLFLSIVALICFSTSIFASNFDDTDRLIEGAKKDGHLMVYTSGDANQTISLLSRFKEKYPFMKTEIYRAGKVKLLTKILMEHKFKRYTADVTLMSAIQTNILKKEGALEKYSPPEGRFLTEESRDPQGYWHAVYLTGMLCGYNNRLVSSKEAPKTYEDLLDPKWKGKLGIDSNNIEWFSTLLKIKGEGFLEKLSRQRPSMRDGQSLSVQLLAAGEYSMLLDSYEYRMLESKDKGMPIDWVALEPVIIYFVSSSLAANAPHPYAAKLFINYLLTETGQQSVVQWGRTPIRSDVGSRNKKMLDKYKLIVTDIDTAEKEKEINPIIQKYFR